MKKTIDDKVIFRHFQLPLGFGKTDPGDLERVMAFLDDRFAAGSTARLSELFCRFSGQPDEWSVVRFIRSISSLFSDRMISCVMNGSVSLPHHSSAFLETPDRWERIQVIPRKRLSACELGAIAGICQNIFGLDCPSDQDGLIHFIDNSLNQWKASLKTFGRLAENAQYPGAADIQSCLSFIQSWQTTADPYERICAVRNRESALASFAHTYHCLKNFYEKGVGRWELCQKSIEKLSEFHPEIASDPEAAADLSRLRHLLQMPRPWNDLDCLDDLIARIIPAYERICHERFTRLQHEALVQINQMIESISALLEKAHARAEVRNMALVELQKIKKAIELDNPGSLFCSNRVIAEEAFERAQDIVYTRG